MRDIVFNLTFGSMLLAIALLLWAVFELRDQRDFWREYYCYEVLKPTPEHVCAREGNINEPR